MMDQSGLFSAVVTSFIIQGYGSLQQAPDANTIALLAQISYQIALASNGTRDIPPPPPSSSPQFTPTAMTMCFNAFWFLSLLFSLTCALMATLVQQWARQYLHAVGRRTAPETRARVRAYLYEGVEKFKVPLIVEAIPALLHISVFLFFAGLVVFMVPINATIGLAILAAVALIACAYLAATIASAFYLDCPYRTPLSSPCWRSLQAFRFAAVTFGGWRRWGRPYRGPLADIREKEASRRNSAALLTRDVHALRWTTESLTQNADFEPFAESIPSLIHNYQTRIVLEQLLSDADSNLPGRISGLLRGSLQSDGNPNPNSEKMILTSLRATFTMTSRLTWQPWSQCADQLTATYLPLLASHRNPLVAHYARCSATIAKYRLTNDLLMPVEKPSDQDARRMTIALKVLGGQTILDQLHGFPGVLLRSDKPPTREQHEMLKRCRAWILTDFCTRLTGGESLLPQTEGGEVLRRTLILITGLVYYPAYDSDDAYQLALVYTLGDLISHDEKAQSEHESELPPAIVYYILRRLSEIVSYRSAARSEAARVFERYMADRRDLGAFGVWFDQVGRALRPRVE